MKHRQNVPKDRGTRRGEWIRKGKYIKREKKEKTETKLVQTRREEELWGGGNEKKIIKTDHMQVRFPMMNRIVMSI